MRLAQINVAHQRVAQHRINMAFGEDAALVQHRDGLRQSADEMHVVFDDHDRRAVVHFDDDRSAATLDVLADLGERSQVLLFTHHGQVRDQAARLGSRVRILELGATA